MKAHWRYLQYVIRHKWLVFIECAKEGLIYRGIVHDISKFSRAEWCAYVDKFFREKRKSEVIDTQFKVAWEHHFMRNTHHWDHWCHDSLGLRPHQLEKIPAVLMPREDMMEMICDWRAMTVARHGYKDMHERTRNWYLSQQDKMNMHPITEELVENILLSADEGWGK